MCSLSVIDFSQKSEMRWCFQPDLYNARTAHQPINPFTWQAFSVKNTWEKDGYEIPWKYCILFFRTVKISTVDAILKVKLQKADNTILSDFKSDRVFLIPISFPHSLIFLTELSFMYLGSRWGLVIMLFKHFTFP